MERLRPALPLLAVLLFFALLLVPTLSPDVQLFYRDTSRLYYPVKRFIAEEISAGRLPFWYPWSESGTSLLGQVTPGLLHPFTLLYAALPFELAFKLNHLFALPLAALGAFLLCRRVGATPWAAAAGGLLYGGSALRAIEPRLGGQRFRAGDVLGRPGATSRLRRARGFRRPFAAAAGRSVRLEEPLPRVSLLANPVCLQRLHHHRACRRAARALLSWGWTQGQAASSRRRGAGARLHRRCLGHEQALDHRAAGVAHLPLRGEVCRADLARSRRGGGARHRRGSWRNAPRCSLAPGL